MKIPKKLVNFNLFVNGRDKAGTITELTLPSLEMKTEDYKSGGMDVPIAVEGGGMEALTATFVLAEYDSQILGNFGFKESGPVQLEARGAGKYHNSLSAYIVRMSGIISKVEWGNWKAGDTNMNQPFTVKCNYLLIEIDGRTVVEIDAINLKRVIDGEDQLSAIRAILGI